MVKNQTLITILCSLVLTSISGVYTSQTNQLIAAETISNNPLDNTEWELVSWDESQPLGEKRPTISFMQKNIAGTSGCNRYVGGFKIKENTFSVSGPLAGTRMACPEPLMTQEFLFLQALQGAKIYTINPKNQLQIAYLKEKRLGIMTFKPLLKGNQKSEKLMDHAAKTRQS